MNTSSTMSRRVSAAAATALLLTAALALPASARQDPGQPSAASGPTGNQRCSLARVGSQFVACDYLTGNGVPAPAWMPKR